jgi:hypothetical protein
LVFRSDGILSIVSSKFSIFHRWIRVQSMLSLIRIGQKFQCCPERTVRRRCNASIKILRDSNQSNFPKNWSIIRDIIEFQFLVHRTAPLRRTSPNDQIIWMESCSIWWPFKTDQTTPNLPLDWESFKHPQNWEHGTDQRQPQAILFCSGEDCN